MRCKHEHVREIATRVYRGPVAVEPYTTPNPVACGNICTDVECSACGARRQENRNAGQSEVSPWGPTRAEREAHDRHSKDARERAARDAEDAAMRRHGMRVLRLDGAHALILRDGWQDPQWILIDDIRAAADQADNDDGLAPAYRGLHRAVCRARHE